MSKQKINMSSCGVPKVNTTTTSSVPVSLNASGLGSVLKQMAEAQMAEQMQKLTEQVKAQAINPVKTIVTSSERMAEMYARYEALQEIGKLLNGVPLSDPIPEALSLEDITITFRVKDANSETGYTDFKTASIKNVICAGDIYKLLSGEMGILILTLEQEIKAIREIAEKSETQYEKARKQWETANPDRQIRPVTTTESITV